MYSNAINKEEAKELYKLIDERLSHGQAIRDTLVHKVANTVIRDRLVPPKKMIFGDDNNGLCIIYDGEIKSHRIHRHALNQLCQKVNFPITYLNTLTKDSERWKLDLLKHNLNELFWKTEFPDRSGTPRFLHRIVGSELRGFLSRRFNRQIASLPLLVSFVDACSRSGAVPIDAVATDVKSSLKCMLPVAFEPIPGEVVSFGVEWSNSDFGAGRLQVSFCLWTPRTNRFSVLDTSISRVHIGSVLEDSDIEMSEDTANKEAEAQCSAVQDAVKTMLDEEAINKVLGVIKRAHEEQIPWRQLRVHFQRLLNKQEYTLIESVFENDIIELPTVSFDATDGTRIPNKWWAAQALSWLASKQDDLERKLELEHASGNFLPAVK